ncbi:transposase [Streptomyces sp. NPDC002962]|uniref:transposase n=1 Tax=Streptomyces sp. NPDC002962 TaxID=3364674 RepID=UPI0036B60CB2
MKRGTDTVGAQRHIGIAGRIENVQVAIYLVYAGSRGHAAADRELYVPRSWTSGRRGTEPIARRNGLRARRVRSAHRHRRLPRADHQLPASPSGPGVARRGHEIGGRGLVRLLSERGRTEDALAILRPLVELHDTTQRYPVSAGLVCGQAYQDVLRGCRIPPQPGQPGVIEARHALNLAGLPCAVRPSVLAPERAIDLTETLLLRPRRPRGPHPRERRALFPAEEAAGLGAEFPGRWSWAAGCAVDRPSAVDCRFPGARLGGGRALPDP